MKHLLLSRFGPVGVSRVEETARNVFNDGCFRFVWFLCRRWFWFDLWGGRFVGYPYRSFNRLSERGKLCRCVRGTLWCEGGGYCFIQYPGSSFNPLFDGEG